MSQSENQNNVIKIISGSKGKFPIKLGIIPNRLAVSIYLHQMNVGGQNLPCWTYVSDGLISLKHKELMITLQTTQGEDTAKFPTQPLQLFLLAYKYAAQEKFLSIGDVINLGEKGLFGFPAAAFSYPLVEIPNTPLQRPTLSTVLLSKEEFLTAQTFGFTRVLSRLGFEQKRYPCSGAIDRQRKSLNLQKVLQHSSIKNLPRTSIKEGSVIMSGGDHVVLNLPPTARVVLAKLLQQMQQQKTNTAFCLLLQLLPRHEGCLTWIPEQGATEMHMHVTASGEAIAGCFIRLEPNQMEDGATIVEDGFSMQFTPANWQNFANAVLQGQGLHIPGTGGGMDFSLTWGNQPAPVAAVEEEEEQEGGFFARMLNKFKK